MSFVIATAVNAAFAPVLKESMPSWIKNSGASEIRVHRFESPEYENPNLAFYAAVPLRCAAMREAILDAVERQERLVFLDADAFTIRNIEGGFSDNHAFSVARWPRWNMGVIFVNTLRPFPWRIVLDRMVDEVARRCCRLATTSPDELVPDDQHVWQEILGEVTDEVHKLDWHEWNMCIHWREWREHVLRYRDTMRIAHLKTRSKHWRDNLATLREYYGDLI